MGDYAVTVTHALERPIRDIDPLLDLLGDDVAASVSDSELSVSTSLVAADTTAAHSLAIAVVGAAAETAGIPLGRVLEVEVTEWERFERTLEEPNLPDLVSAPEVGEILGVSRQRVHQLIKENRSFPPPLLRLGSGPLWLRATIEAFDRSWTRKPGRPAGAGSTDPEPIDLTGMLAQSVAAQEDQAESARRAGRGRSA